MINSFQLTSRISIPVLENTKWEIKYVNSTWTTSLLQEIQQYNVQIKLQAMFHLSKQRSNDSNIMEYKINHKHQLTSELEKSTRVESYFESATYQKYLQSTARCWMSM